MNIFLWLTGSILVSVLLNWVSEKIHYPYDSKKKWMVVLLNGLLWAMYYQKYHLSTHGFNINMVLLAIATAILIAIIFIDLQYYEIPNEYNLTLLLIGIVWIFTHLSTWQNWVLGGIISFGFYLLLMMLSKGNLGGGDVKLVGALGLMVGFQWLIPFIMVTFLMGSIVSLVLLFLKKKKKQDKIAFGPYISLGFIYVFLFFL